jgi:signal transduction histidine kinase
VQDASPDTFVLWDAITGVNGEMVDARLSYANPAAYRLANRPLDSLIGAHIDDVFPGHRQSDRFSMYTEVFRTGEIREATFKHSQLDLWMRVVVMRVDRGLGIFATDVTAQREAEIVLRRSRDDLEQLVADRTRELHAARDLAVVANRAKSAFLSRASHELRTPLNSVIGFSGILLKNRSGLLEASELGYLERISRNGKHLLDLVNDLLDLSKIEAGKVTLELAPVSLFDLVHEVRETLEPRAREIGLILTTDHPGVATTHPDFRVIADEQRLRQVLLNLAGNAIKYTTSGRVIIRVIADQSEIPERVDVIDTGPGIADDQIDSIFEPFVVGDAPPQGEEATGLGLTISRSLCDLMGYRLSVSSRIGVGTTFSIHLLP